MNDLYTNELSYLINFFLPSMKLLSKQRIGSKIIRVHDKPKTPFQRIIETKILDKEKREKLLRILLKINPYKIQKEVRRKIDDILKLVSK